MSRSCVASMRHQPGGAVRASARWPLRERRASSLARPEGPGIRATGHDQRRAASKASVAAAAPQHAWRQATGGPAPGGVRAASAAGCRRPPAARRGRAGLGEDPHRAAADEAGVPGQFFGQLVLRAAWRRRRRGSSRAARIASASTQPPPSVPSGRSRALVGRRPASRRPPAACCPACGRRSRRRTACPPRPAPASARKGRSSFVGARHPRAGATDACARSLPTLILEASEPPMPYTLTVNGRASSVDVPADMPLLWVLRDVLDLKGTKFGCGMAQCGACTVHVGRRADARRARRRSSAVGAVDHHDRGALDRRRASGAAGVAGPSTCRSAATARPGRSWRPRRCSRRTPTPSDADIDAAMNGNICRCGDLRAHPRRHPHAAARGRSSRRASAEAAAPAAKPEPANVR